MSRLKILISAYACSPNRGSEPGMGWNFVTRLAHYHEVHVITEKRKWEIPIRDFLVEYPDVCENLKFYFIDKKRNKWLRQIWPPSYYWFYKKWQQHAYNLALNLDLKENFDLIHQLNMVGYREPGYLWKFDKPFIWGPIGGLENSPWSFLPSLGPKGMVYYAGRNLLNLWQRNFNIRPKKAAHHLKGVILAATLGNAELIRKLWKKDAIVMCEVGKEDNILNPLKERLSTEPLKIIWSGMHTPGKNLPLLLKALQNISIPFILHILGKGEKTENWKKRTRNLKIEDYCIWHDWLKRDEAIEVMSNGHVLCITSVKDLTSTVTLEALSFGVPIICLNHFGFANVVNEKCGFKIPVDNPSASAKVIQETLEKLYHNEYLRQKLCEGALQRASDFSWDKKINKLNEIYFASAEQKTKK